MSEPDYTADMRLPSGRGCADCFAVRFCVGIGCTTPVETSCDYWPNRFRLSSLATFSPRRPPATPYEPPIVTPIGNVRDLLAQVCAGGDCDLE